MKKRPSKEEILRESVLKFFASTKNVDDYMAFLVAVHSATRLGDGLSMDVVKSMIEECLNHKVENVAEIGCPEYGAYCNQCQSLKDCYPEHITNLYERNSKINGVEYKCLKSKECQIWKDIQNYSLQEAWLAIKNYCIRHRLCESLVIMDHKDQ